MQTETVTLDDGVDAIVVRESLYFNKFKYRGVVHHMNGARLFARSDSVETFIMRVARYYSVFDAKKLSDYYEWRSSITADQSQIMFRHEYAVLYIYCNDITRIRSIEKCNVEVKVDQVVLQKRVKGVQFFKNKPLFRYRTYLKSTRIQKDDVKKFIEFLDEYSDKLYASPALSRHRSRILDYHHRGYHSWLSSSWFIDYDESQVESYLYLMWPEYMGKSFRLLKHGESVEE